MNNLTMNDSPLFSIVIPTRGRSHIVHYAIESVLRQSFIDFEVILVDNDLSDATAEVCKKYLGDPRFRYHRTGNLSMPDNWEYGLKHSTGHFFLLIEDKMFLSKHALAKLKNIFERENPDFLVWELDHYDEKTNKFRSSRSLKKHQWLESDDALRLVAKCNLKEYWPLAPRGFNFATSRENIRKASRYHPDGLFFAPLSPDFMSGFAMLLTFKKYLLISTTISCTSFGSLSNGLAVILKQECGKQFLKDIGGPADLSYAHTPIKSIRCNNSIINDFLSIIPYFQRTGDFPIDLKEYFLMNWGEILFALSHGVNMAEEIQAYFNALESLNDETIANEILLRMKEVKDITQFFHSPPKTPLQKTVIQKILRETSKGYQKLQKLLQKLLCPQKRRFTSIDAFLEQY